jgi:ribonuclease J
MNITIHRGTHQIGGCVTEIRTKKTRIFIDMGSELPDKDGNIVTETLSIDGITKGEKNCDAVFFTHYHGDHIGMIASILPGVPMYMGKAAKEIYIILQKRVNREIVPIVETINTFEIAKKIQSGDITITPFMVDHSAYDAYMFLIEADGKKILHTGDFRTHGFRGKGVIPTLKTYVKKVDVLITEGTMLSRNPELTKTEHMLQGEFRKLISEYKYVFVICSSTNIDRIASLHKSTPRGKYFLSDRYQKEVTDVVIKYAAEYSSLYSLKKVLFYNKAIKEKVQEIGFCMLVRGNDQFKEIMQEYRDTHNSECLVIYSLWEGYLNQPDSRYKELIEGFQNVSHIHTSGHATLQAIDQVCRTVAPSQAIIPIHSENPERLNSLDLPYHIEYLKDGQVYEVK